MSLFGRAQVPGGPGRGIGGIGLYSSSSVTDAGSSNGVEHTGQLRESEWPTYTARLQMEQ